MRRLIILVVALLIAPTAVAHADECGAHVLGFGQECSSHLSQNSAQARDGSRIELWQFDGAGGDCVAVEMNANQFTPYLQLIRGTSTGPVVVQGENAIRTTLPSAGTYYVKATSAGSGYRDGGYTVRLDRCQ
jgi:hypothetical protein